MKYKIKRIPISPDVLISVMRNNSSWRVSKGIPKTARFRGVPLDVYTQNIQLFVEDDSFEEIDIDEIIPILYTEFYKIQ